MGFLQQDGIEKLLTPTVRNALQSNVIAAAEAELKTTLEDIDKETEKLLSNAFIDDFKGTKYGRVQTTARQNLKRQAEQAAKKAAAFKAQTSGPSGDNDFLFSDEEQMGKPLELGHWLILL